MLLQKKSPSYIDFKTTNDLISANILLKIWNYRFLVLCALNMLQLHRLMWKDHLAVLKIF
jgi:hypothetical protein